MKTFGVKNIVLTAMLVAMSYIATAFIKIPIPLGYANFGNTILFIAVLFWGTRKGLFAGAVGSALADLLSPYAIWTIPTLLVKIGIALAVGLIGNRKGQSLKLGSFRTFLAVFSGGLMHVVGYVIAGAVLYGGLAAGISSAPALAMEAAVNIMVFYLLGNLLHKMKINQLLENRK